MNYIEFKYMCPCIREASYIPGHALKLELSGSFFLLGMGEMNQLVLQLNPLITAQNYNEIGCARVGVTTTR